MCAPNADTGADAAEARRLGAEGIGLCRTEHMFLGERLPVVRRMLLTAGGDEHEAALYELQEVQRADFVEVFEAMDGLPVTVRLLDAPLHEFLEETHEQNPMLGLRGTRLAIATEGLYQAQVRAVLEGHAGSHRHRWVIPWWRSWFRSSRSKGSWRWCEAGSRPRSRRSGSRASPSAP